MAKLRINAPDGKVLNIDVPEGTPPEKYDSVVENVVNHYRATAMDPRYLDPKEASSTDWDTEFNPAADLYMAGEGLAAAPGMVRAIPKVVKAIPEAVKAAPAIARGLAKGVGTLAEDFSGGLAKGANAVGDVLKGGWDALTNNTPRGFGFAQGAGATPEARAGAREAIDFANEAHPEVGDLVSRSAHRPISMPPESGPALPTGEKGLATAEDVSKMPPGPGEAPTDLPQPNTDLFNNPIRKGVLSSPEEMLETATSQRNAVGKGIENTLSKYDASGSFYDPTSFNTKVKSMLERDAAGNVMTTGWQGEINTAIKDAASSINDFAVNGPIKWSDAARIKSGLQGGSKYGVQGLSKSEEAYKQVASLLKEDIDDQAMAMLQKQGGNIQEYQQLRDAYGKYDKLADALNVAAKRKFANSPIPWWIKMGAGAALGSTGLGIAKGLMGHP